MCLYILVAYSSISGNDFIGLPYREGDNAKWAYPSYPSESSFLLTCGGIESVAWHPNIVGRRSFGPNKTGPHEITTHTPVYTTESHLQSVIWPWAVESRLYAWSSPPPIWKPEPILVSSHMGSANRIALHWYLLAYGEHFHTPVNDFCILNILFILCCGFLLPGYPLCELPGTQWRRSAGEAFSRQCSGGGSIFCTACSEPVRSVPCEVRNRA